jgi:SH3-like domain-containing protein
MRQFLILLLLLICAAANAAETDGEEGSGTTGLPLPRFASLRVNEVNLRTGPGTRYPIDWVYVRQGLPVEITAEFDIWRHVRDWDGSEGWVHKSALTGKRTAIVTGTMRDMFRYDDTKAPVLAHLEPGAVGQLVSCKVAWCKVKFSGIKGYLRKTDFWGAYPNEVFD